MSRAEGVEEHPREAASCCEDDELDFARIVDNLPPLIFVTIPACTDLRFIASSLPPLNLFGGSARNPGAARKLDEREPAHPEQRSSQNDVRDGVRTMTAFGE